MLGAIFSSAEWCDREEENGAYKHVLLIEVVRDQGTLESKVFPVVKGSYEIIVVQEKKIIV